MNKTWLSQLLDDSAFPLLVLALALSHIKLGSYKRSNFLHQGRQPAELRLDERLQTSSGNNRSSSPSPSAVSKKERAEH
jgi:hypothetical protein